MGCDLALDVVVTNLARRARELCAAVGCKPHSSWTADAILAMHAKILARCTRRPFALNQLHVTIEPSVYERIARTFTKDPCHDDVARFVEGKSVVRSAEIETGVFGGTMTSQQHGRVHRVMTHLGYRKGEATIDGQRVKAFRKVEAAQ